MKQLRDHKAQGSALFTLVSGIVIVIAVIFFLIKLAGSGSFGDVAETTEAATQTRIQPVGQLKMGDGIPVGERQGDQIFNKISFPCGRHARNLYIIDKAIITVLQLLIGSAYHRTGMIGIHLDIICGINTPRPLGI